MQPSVEELLQKAESAKRSIEYDGPGAGDYGRWHEGAPTSRDFYENGLRKFNTLPPLDKNLYHLVKLAGANGFLGPDVVQGLCRETAAQIQEYYGVNDATAMQLAQAVQVAALQQKAPRPE